MMRSLTVAEICYLLRVLDLDPTTRNQLESATLPIQRMLTDEQIDALRDQCGERLQEVGFDLEYEPTEEGRTLENLIDKLFIG